MEDGEAIARVFEPSMPGPETQPLFDLARELGIGFYLGYAELTGDGRRFNTSVLVDETGGIVGRYRKIHLPGHADHKPEAPFQHLEKKYFEVGNEGRSEEHTSELQSLMRISYAVFCLKKKKKTTTHRTQHNISYN